MAKKRRKVSLHSDVYEPVSFNLCIEIAWFHFECPWLPFKVTSCRNQPTFTMVNCVKEMTGKTSCKCGSYGLFIILCFCYWVTMVSYVKEMTAKTSGKCGSNGSFIIFCFCHWVGSFQHNLVCCADTAVYDEGICGGGHDVCGSPHAWPTQDHAHYAAVQPAPAGLDNLLQLVRHCWCLPVLIPLWGWRGGGRGSVKYVLLLLLLFCPSVEGKKFTFCAKWSGFERRIACLRIHSLTWIWHACFGFFLVWFLVGGGGGVSTKNLCRKKRFVFF